MSSIEVPIFGTGGRIEGDLLDGGVPSDTPTPSLESGPALNSLSGDTFLSPAPTMIFRDPSSELEAGLKRYDETYARLYPALKAAHDVRDRRQLAARDWWAKVKELRLAVSNARNLASRGSLEYEDSTNVSRKDRVTALELQLDEATQELEAAIEELEQAKALVEKELAAAGVL
jgi:hypothetical protein